MWRKTWFRQGRPNRPICQPLSVWMVESPNPQERLTAQMTYRASDPFAVTLSFLAGGEPTVSYTFARELLTDGLDEATGDGDVQVAPHAKNNYLIITLTPEDGALPMSLFAERAPVESFLDQAYDLVPMGMERLNLDALIARILREVSL